jgi:hypothetical protein
MKPKATALITKKLDYNDVSWGFTLFVLPQTIPL